MRVNVQDIQFVSLVFRDRTGFLREARRGTKPAEAEYFGRGGRRGRGRGEPCRIN